ncbi:MAG: GGDEF domain-containing protein [Spirochaetales bacterium]|nr:GGDEF domain-containing protein [Spirochaetales bacterium]
MIAPKTSVKSSSWRSLVVPSLLILALFLAIGIYVITTILNFYYHERAEEASVLAKSYTSVLSTVIDAEQQIDDQLHSTLRVAGVTVSKYVQPFSQELLATMASNLDVDVIYLYDENLTVTQSSNGEYLGWEVPEGHPIDAFYQSGAAYLVEKIREDTVSGIPHKYGYHRFEDGRMVQVGIFASNITKLYSQFEPQYIVDKLSHDSEHTLLALLDVEGSVIAASDQSLVGSAIQPETIGLPISETQYKQITWDTKEYLAFHLPIVIKEEDAGSLVLFYDLSSVNILMLRISIIVSISLLLFFLLFLFSFHNIHRKNQKILNIAYHDELTGLHNIRYYHEYIASLKSKRVACIVLNPINFRMLNMLYGYDHGDMVLIGIGEMLTKLSVQYKPCQPFRLSDDRFLMVISDYQDDEVLNSFCSSMLGIKEKAGLFGSIEICLGLVKSEGPYDSTRMLREALIALNATSVTNRIQFFNEHLEEILLERDAIESELKLAISSAPNGLSLVFQPIIESGSGKIRSFEALARLTSQKLGMISPLTFIQIAEQRQLIIPLGKKILSLACDFIATLQSSGYDSISVAVNISAIQLMHESFVPDLVSLLREKGVQNQNLELELTESVFTQDMELLSNQLSTIRTMGIRISIDDFGTGYSSLSRLGTLPIDTLKLDKQFVDKLQNNEAQARGLASDIISMAHHIGKVVVAEGVEEQEQRSILTNMECDLLQGYLFSKPIPAQYALKLLESKGELDA